MDENQPRNDPNIIRGRVVDTQGRPILAIDIILYNNQLRYGPLQTNEFGSFVFPKLSTGTYYLSFSDRYGRGFAPRQDTIELKDRWEAPRTITLSYAEGEKKSGEHFNEIYGTLVDDLGKPILSASLFVTGPVTFGLAVDRTTGAFSQPHLPNGNYGIKGRSGTHDIPDTPISLRGQDTGPLTIIGAKKLKLKIPPRRKQGIFITGIVYGENNQNGTAPPLQNIQVVFECDSASHIVKRTNQSGHFSSPNLSEEIKKLLKERKTDSVTYTVSFRDLKKRYSFASVKVSVGMTSPDPLSIRPLKNGNSISGTVFGIEEKGKRKRLAKITVQITGSAAGQNLTLTRTTNAFGGFSTAGASLSPGMYRITCIDPEALYTFPSSSAILSGRPVHITIVGTSTKKSEEKEEQKEEEHGPEKEEKPEEQQQKEKQQGKPEEQEPQEEQAEQKPEEEAQEETQAESEDSVSPEEQTKTQVKEIQERFESGQRLSEQAQQEQQAEPGQPHPSLQDVKELQEALARPTEEVNVSPRFRPNVSRIFRPLNSAARSITRGATNAANSAARAGAQGARAAAQGAQAAAQGAAAAGQAVSTFFASPPGWITLIVIGVILLILIVIFIIIMIFNGSGSTKPPQGTSNQQNNTSTSGTIPGLTVSKTGPDQVDNGQDITYTITVSYSGSLDVTIEDDLSDNATITNASGVTASKSDHSVTWLLKNNQSGGSGSGQYTFTVTAHPSANDIRVTNSVKGTAPGGTSPNGPPIPDLTITKSGPDNQSLLNYASFSYQINISYSGDKDVTIHDDLPSGISLKSASPNPTSMSGNALSWHLNDMKSPNGSYTFTLNVQDDTPDILAENKAYATAPSDTGSSSQPTHDTCGGKYILNNPIGNFGDPNCNFTEDQMLNQLKEQDPAHAARWFAISQCESSHIPNTYASHESIGTPDPSGAWGLFQMGSRFSPAGHSSLDHGDVDWPQQISNAIQYNKLIGESFAYWACARTN